MSFFIFLATFILSYQLIISNFDIDYVARYTSIETPTIYKISALWAGQSGSLLFWLFILSIFSTITNIQNQELEDLPFDLAGVGKNTFSNFVNSNVCLSVHETNSVGGFYSSHKDRFVLCCFFVCVWVFCVCLGFLVPIFFCLCLCCLLYTSDAADE